MAPELTILSFAYRKGVPRDANLVLDMRFLRNPHWQEELRDLDGLDAAVAAYIAGDPSHAGALAGIEALLLTLLPLYMSGPNTAVRVAFGCTGGRHRSVHAAERVAARLRAAGFSPSLEHRDLATPPRDAIGRSSGAGTQDLRADDGFQGG